MPEAQGPQEQQEQVKETLGDILNRTNKMLSVGELTYTLLQAGIIDLETATLMYQIDQKAPSTNEQFNEVVAPLIDQLLVPGELRSAISNLSYRNIPRSPQAGSRSPRK